MSPSRCAVSLSWRMPSDVWTAKSTGMPNFTRTASPRCLPGVHFGDLPMTRQYLVRKGFIGRFEYFGIAHRAVLLDDERDQDFPVNVFAEGFRRVFHVHLYPPAKLADVAAVELRRGIHHQERLFPGAFVFTGLSVLCRSSYSEINGSVYLTRTFSPRCSPGFHLGEAATTRRVSSENALPGV